MPLPQRPLVALSVVAAYAAASYARRAAQTPSLASPILSFLAAGAVAYILQAAAYAVYAIFVYPHLLSPLRHLPQPATGNHVVLGQFPRMHREPTGKPAQDWINTIPNDGLIRYLGIFNQERLLVTKPKALAEVLVGRNYDFEKPAMVREPLRRLLGVGVLLAEGDAHRFQRRQLSPAFAFRHVKDLYPVFWDKGRQSVRAMQSLVAASHESESGVSSETAGALEICGWASRTTLDIIGAAGLGRDFGAIQDPDNELAATYSAMLHPDKSARLLGMLGLVFPRWLLGLLPVQRNADIEAANVYIKQVCRDLIAEKRRKLKGDTSDTSHSERDILSVALESGGFTDEELVAQLMTFLAAGHETTSSALTWAVYQLCAHPAVQDRLRQEIRDKLPPLDGRTPSSAEIDQLPFLHAVCSEVLRYMAPVPLTMREACVDTVIQGQRVPRGTLVVLVPWAVNRSTDLWGATATEFDPERWLSPEAPAPSNYSFMTFLHGPRSCIGQGFARAEFACVLAAWVGRFAFRIQDAADLDEETLAIHGSVSSRPTKGLHVYASVVEGW